jgi:hypothetical protein
MPRAMASSSSNVASGGMESSRSIIVGTSPKRRRACAYNPHTPSHTGASWVSINRPEPSAATLCPARWICRIACAGKASR